MSGDGQSHVAAKHKDFKIRLRWGGKEEGAVILAEKEFTKGRHGPGGELDSEGGDSVVGSKHMQMLKRPWRLYIIASTGNTV